MNILEKFKDLLNDAQNLNDSSDKIDSIKRRLDMFIRKEFSNDSEYLSGLASIKFSSRVIAGQTLSTFNTDKTKLINLISTIIEDIEITNSATTIKTEASTNINSNKIFIVHGHNDEMKQTIARTVEKLKLEAIILHEQASLGKTIIDKFETNSNVAFAIVLLSSDDEGYKKGNSSEARPRARQNVIFEMGYFIGKLGKERVAVIYDNSKNFEFPSDYTGVIYIPFDQGAWEYKLITELQAVGIMVDANDLTRKN